VIDPDGYATGIGAGINISPAIADHVATAEIQSVSLGGVKHQSRAGFSAIAVISIVVIASKYSIQWKFSTQTACHGFDDLALLCAAANIGLVGHYQENKIPLFELFQGGSCAVRNSEIGNSRRRVRLSISHDRLIEYAVTIKEYGTTL
jgi:hypothetical protein